MPTVREIEGAVYGFAPRRLAQSWDNVGLLIGDGGREVRRVLVALDVTEDAAAEASEQGAELILAHHPVMNCTWRPVQSLLEEDIQGRLLRRLVRDGTAVICMHTNLDAAEEGVNAALARALGLEDAGPVVEEGIERIGSLSAPMDLPAFLALVGERLRPNGIRYVDAGRPIRRVAVGGGACADFLEEAARLGCDAFVTADVKYNQFLDAKALGISLIDAGHFPTEDVVCPVLVSLLREKFPGLAVEKSARHREVFSYWTPGREGAP